MTLTVIVERVVSNWGAYAPDFDDSVTDTFDRSRERRKDKGGLFVIGVNGIAGDV